MVSNSTPTLTAPGTERLKLKHEEVPSIFGFKFHLRRYNTGAYVVLSAAGDFTVPEPVCFSAVKPRQCPPSAWSAL